MTILPTTPVGNQFIPVESASKRSWSTIAEKIGTILDLLKRYKWSIGDLLYYLFVMKDLTTGRDLPVSRTHTQMVSKFLGGETRVPISAILDAWHTSAYGRPPLDNDERKMMFSTDMDYHNIRHARPVITSFAAQKVRNKMVDEARKAVKANSGLHTFTTAGNDTSRYELGASAFPEAMDIFQTQMPLAWDLMMAMATPNDEASTRERRPPHLVGTSVFGNNQY
jgi:hypothetical protein